MSLRTIKIATAQMLIIAMHYKAMGEPFIIDELNATTAAVTTGPASGPLPASSTPYNFALYIFFLLMNKYT